MARCDQEIFDKGSVVAILDCKAVIMEAIVVEASGQCNIKMDWFYAGGRAVVKTLGDIEKSKQAIQLATPTMLQI